MPKKYTTQELEARVVKVHGSGRYKYNWDNYKKTTDKMPIWCSVCNEWFEQRLSDHLNGRGCRKCGAKQISKKLRMSKEEFLEKAKSIHNNNFDYSLVEPFRNNREKIKIICKTCNRIFEQTIHNHLNGDGCPYCRGKYKTTKEFIQQLIDKQGSIFYFDDVEYKGATTKIEITCKKCGNKFLAKPHKLLSGHGCPYCKASRGEKAISVFLKSHGIKFESQKIFPDCKDKRALPFDFYLPDYNACIEYQGEQHYEPKFHIHFYGHDEGIKRFEIQKDHDSIKKEYCRRKHITLIEITYKDNIKNVLRDLLFVG